MSRQGQRRSILEVIYQWYRIKYRLRPDTIEIVMVAHGSQNLSSPDNPPREG